MKNQEPIYLHFFFLKSFIETTRLLVEVSLGAIPVIEFTEISMPVNFSSREIHLLYDHILYKQYDSE